MEIKDMLAVPQLFCIKKDGVLVPILGIGDEIYAVKSFYLFTQHNTVGCGNPSCDCTDKAFAATAKGCEVVPVSIVEVAEMSSIVEAVSDSMKRTQCRVWAADYIKLIAKYAPKEKQKALIKEIEALK